MHVKINVYTAYINILIYIYVCKGYPPQRSMLSYSLLCVTGVDSLPTLTRNNKPVNLALRPYTRLITITSNRKYTALIIP